MSSEANEDAAVQPKKGRVGLGPWIAAIVIALLSNAGWAAVFLYAPNQAAAEVAEEPVEASTKGVARAPGPLMNLNPFVVNLSDAGSTRYLKIGISLELSAESDRATIEKYLVPLRDQYIRHLSSLEPGQLLSAQDKDDLKTVLMERTESVLPQRAVREIYFTEFMMQ